MNKLFLIKSAWSARYVVATNLKQAISKYDMDVRFLGLPREDAKVIEAQLIAKEIVL